MDRRGPGRMRGGERGRGERMEKQVRARMRRVKRSGKVGNRDEIGGERKRRSESTFFF